MKRRDFLRTTLGTAGAAAMTGFGAPLALAEEATGAEAGPAKSSSALRLTLIHTNDVHSHMEPMGMGRYAGLGGAPARAALIKKIRDASDHLLLLDAGDIIQGTAYFNLFQGEPEFRAMSMQNYDAAAIGNHDFDAGLDRMADLIDNFANFPMLCANYDFNDTPVKGKTRESIVKEIDGARVGIFGLGIKLQGLVSGRMFGATQYLDPTENARRVARQLRHDEKCDFIICLSHLNVHHRDDPGSQMGEAGDRDLITDVPEIDVILGGHNHFRLTERFDREGAGTGYVNQTGWAGTHLGVLQFDLFDKQMARLANHSHMAVA